MSDGKRTSPPPGEAVRAPDVPWRLAASYADHIRELPVRETGMVQLGRGPVDWKTVRSLGAHSVIVRFQAGPLMTGHLVPADGWMMVYAPMGWGGDYIFNGQEARPGDVSVVTSRVGYVSTGRDRDVLGVALRVDRLQRTMAALSGRPDSDYQLSDCLLKLGEAAGAALRREILALQRETFSIPQAPGTFLVSPHTEARLVEVVARVVLGMQSGTASVTCSVTSDLRVVSAARATADNHPDATLADLCAAARVGETKLYKSFVSIHGISPARYLRQLRLTRAREWLCDAERPPTSVKDAALCLGFTHGGRFAAEYQRAFGESPSVTLDRTLAKWRY